MGLPARKLPSPREELLELQRKIFQRNDRIIRSEAIVEEPGFAAYERQYKRHVASFERPAEVEEVLAAIEAADIIYVGDYHTNPQSQRTLLRLLKLLIGRIPDMALALEMVQDHHQTSLNRYLSGRMTEATFLKKIQFKKYWYFDLWANFKPVFEFARFHKIPVYGIESAEAFEEGLKARDQSSAECIANLAMKHPGQKIFVFVGDLHIAPEHIPNRVDKILKKQGAKKKRLLLYQNSEGIYWELARQRREEKVEVVKVNEESFCFMNTPPIIWQQTFLNWLEHEGEAIDYADAKQTFLDLLERIADFLEISLPAHADEVEVFTCGDLSFLEALRKDKSFTPKELGTIRRQILSSQSYFIPRKQYVYLANMSVNHPAEEAAHYLKYLSAGEEFVRPLTDAFYANALHEALGFFGSKIINHKRKCFHPPQLKQLVEYLHTIRVPVERRLELEIAQLVLDHKKMERRKKPIPHEEGLPHRTEIFLGVTHALGYMLGDRLYHALVNDLITKAVIRDLFYDRMAEEGAPFEVYMDLVRRTEKVKLPRRL